MSALELPTLDAVLDIVGGSIRDDRSAADRRAHARLTGSELSWLHHVRLKNGPRVSVVDLSLGGALLDSRVQMKPGSTIWLEISGRGSTVELPSEVLRCRLSSIADGTISYRGACMFTAPFAFEDVQREPIPQSLQPGSEPAREAPGISTAVWQKIVARYRDGSALRGFTLDFHPSRGHFSLWPSVNATRSERVIVPMARLKALFFVKDFAGNPAHVPDPSRIEEPGAGRRIEVTFFDREVVRGTTLNYRPDGSGFFITPSDTRGNNQRIFVVNGAVLHVRFP